MEILTGVVGALVGVIGTWFYQRWGQRQEYKKVRAALKIEVDHNARLLHEFWGKLNRDDPEDVFDLRLTLIELRDGEAKLVPLWEPVVQWSFRVWDAHLTAAALAYQPSTFSKLYQFYDNLPNIERTYIELSELGQHLHPFDEETDSIKERERAVLWAEFTGIVHDTMSLAKWLRRGN